MGLRTGLSRKVVLSLEGLDELETHIDNLDRDWETIYIKVGSV